MKNFSRRFGFGPLHFALLICLRLTVACADDADEPGSDAAQDGGMRMPSAEGGTKEDGSLYNEPPNREGMEGGVCESGPGLIKCPLLPGACRACLDQRCARSSDPCKADAACKADLEDFLHCRSNGSPLPGELILCTANECADCQVLIPCQ